MDKIKDIAVRLRQTRADMIGTDDEQHYWDCHDAAAEIDRLREAIRRLADQDATLSVCDGNVTVTMDAAFTDAEREAIERGYCSLMGVEDMSAECTRWDAEAAATLQSLLEKHGGER